MSKQSYKIRLRSGCILIIKKWAKQRLQKLLNKHQVVWVKEV
jgi:hypothetical protein